MKRASTFPVFRSLCAAAFFTSSTAICAASCDARPQGVDFGAYDPLQRSAKDGFGAVATRCDGPVNFTIELSPGQGSYADRIMLKGKAQLHYNIYIDAQHRSIWGDGSGGSDTVSVGKQKALVRIYGSIPGGQNPEIGDYTDTIVLTLTY